VQDDTSMVESKGLPVAEQTPRRAPAPDEMYCSSCGNVIKKEAVMCVSCGVPTRRAPAQGPVPTYTSGIAGRGEGKNKVLSILLAIFFGNWTWLYTYREDGSKFWIGLAVGIVGFVISIATLGMGLFLYIPAELAIWIWAIADTVQKSDAWYANY